MDWTLQARVLEWVAFPFSRGSSQPRDRIRVSFIEGRFFNNWDIREAPGRGSNNDNKLPCDVVTCRVQVLGQSHHLKQLMHPNHTPRAFLGGCFPGLLEGSSLCSSQTAGSSTSCACSCPMNSCLDASPSLKKGLPSSPCMCFVSCSTLSASSFSTCKVFSLSFPPFLPSILCFSFFFLILVGR